jgi:two-component system CheB/CheR fusion protein
MEQSTFWMDHIHPNERNTVKAVMERIIEEGTDSYIEYRFKRNDDKYLWVKDLLKVQEDERGHKLLKGLMVDVTDLKNKESQLTKAIEEKNTLFRELHHRIKNNLQLVSSILYLKGRRMTHEESKELIKDINGRILSIARTHEELLRIEEVDQLYIRPYLTNLVRKVTSAYTSNPEKFPLKYYIRNYKLKADQVVVMGLIVHECVVNIIKYAYPDGEGGPIYLGVNRVKDKMYLEIGDDGVGIDVMKQKGVDSHKGKSIGVLLLEALADQLGGNVQIVVDNGSMFRFTFQ